MFKRILVPLDGSTRAESAIPVAARVARASGGVVVLMQVVNIPMEYGPYMVQAGTLTQNTLDVELSASDNYLKNIASSNKLDGVETKIETVYGAPALSIISVAHEQQADLVVICSHGHTGFKRWILGSVAQKVVRHSDIPVLVLREGGPIPTDIAPDAGHPLRVLVTLDGSALAKEALLPAAALAAALSAPEGGVIHLTRVVKLPIEPGYDHEVNTREQAVHRAETYLSSVSEQLKEGPIGKLNLSITWSVQVDEDVAHALTMMVEHGEAEADGHDLLAMATHGRGGLQRWAMGSVTERVINATRFPLLVVRPESVRSGPHAKTFETVASLGWSKSQLH